MTSIKTMFRAGLVALSVLAALPFAAPANAAQADLDLLASYIGNWTGRGMISAAGSEQETVVCRLDIRAANTPDRVNFDGRCTLAGANMAMAGTLAFINNRYEAIMSSSTRFGGNAVGQRNGQAVNFTIQADDGSDVNANIGLNAGQIVVAFRVIDPRSGDVTEATIPFSK